MESALLKHPDVREAAVIGTPDALRGLVVKAFVVSPRRGDDAFARELQEWTRTRLAQHEYPRRVEFVAEGGRCEEDRLVGMAQAEVENALVHRRQGGVPCLHELREGAGPAGPSMAHAWVGDLEAPVKSSCHR